MVGAKMFSFFAFCFVCGTFLSGIMEGETAYAVTLLTADINATATTIAVVNTADFLDGPDDVYIGAEKVTYTNKDATHFLGISRGIEGTEATAHGAGTKVKNESSNILNNILGYNVATTAASYGTTAAIVGLGWNLINAIPRMIAWNYNYLDGQLALAKYLILWPISTGFVFSLGMVFITTVMSIFRR